VLPEDTFAGFSPAAATHLSRVYASDASVNGQPFNIGEDGRGRITLRQHRALNTPIDTDGGVVPSHGDFIAWSVEVIAFVEEIC